MLRNYVLILAALSLTALAGCKHGSTEPTTPEPEPTEEPAPVADDEDGVHFEGSRLVIPRHIQFANNSDVILEESNSLLNSITALLRRAPSVQVLHVTGHTDARGSEADNQSLSERRAAAVVAALRERGLTLEHLWRSPPADLVADGTRLTIVWSVPDAAAWWRQRGLAGQDPSVVAFWADLDELLVSRDRRVCEELDR